MSRCPNCMNELVSKNCSNCGYPLVDTVMVRDALQAGTILKNQYELGNALGNSVQSIAYIAYDRVNQESVIILEFYPKSVVTRKFNDVTIRGNRELYIDANRIFLTSDKLQALVHLDSFAENNTAYRVYRLNGHSALASAEAELLLDDPFLFRNNIGKPTMSINALPIPQLPRAREWTLSPRIQSERKRRLMRNCLVGVVVCIISALAGFFIYDAVRMHPLTITVRTDSDITSAQFAGNPLPFATPNANGEVSYAVSAKKGEYTFSAENMDQMKVEQQMSVSRAGEFAVVIPSPTPAPITITPEQWMLSVDGKYYVADKETGEITEFVGKPDSNITLVSVSVTADESLVKTFKYEKLYLKSGNAEYQLLFSDGAAGLMVSTGEYAVVLDDGEDKKELTKIKVESDSTISLNADAIEFYLKNVRKLGKAEEVLFVGGECNQKTFATMPEELNSWADEYPELFDRVRQYPLEIKMDDAVSEEAAIELNGLSWKNGYEVTVSENIREIEAIISYEKASYRELHSVDKDAAIIIGTQTMEDTLEEAWLKAEKIISTGDGYTLIQEDGSRMEVDKDEFDTARALYKGAFAKESLDKWTKLNLTIDKEVKRDYIARVTVDGKEIPRNGEGGYSADVTPGRYRVEVEFTNGLEAAVYDDVEAKGNQTDEELLKDLRLRATRLKGDLEKNRICGMIETDNGFAWLPKDEKISEEPDTLLKLRELVPGVFVDSDVEGWYLTPVDIYINEAIDTDCIKAITVNGESVAESAEGNGAYAVLKATKYDNFELLVTMEDGKIIPSTEKTEFKPETHSGRYEWHLLDDLAEEELGSLSYWGYSEEEITVIPGDAKYLKRETLDQAMDQAMEEAEIFSLTVIRVAQMNEHIQSYRIRSKDSGDDEYLEPEVTENKFVVYMTAGEYKLTAFANGKEYLIDSIEIAGDMIISLTDADYPEEMFAMIATPEKPTPEEPTPEEPKPEEPTPEETDPKEPVCNHSYVKTKTEDPTCKEKGYIRSYCYKCRHERKVELEPDPSKHVWEKTGEEDGKEVYTCKECGEEDIRIIEEGTVQPTNEPTVEPTVEPTAEPTVEPTAEPTAEPTVEPTVEPTTEPTDKPAAESNVESTKENSVLG